MGLVLHNAAMAQLWELGVRGTALDVVAAWKEGLLLVALLVVAWKVRQRPAVVAADVLAASYAIVIVIYWLIPQDLLGGEATARGELLALRHHLFPVAAYVLGRLDRGGLAGTRPGRRADLAVRSRRGRRRPARHRVRLPPGLAGLRRAGLVRRATRTGLRGAFGAPRELGLQHRRRGEPDPAPRLDVPLPACERVRARRRADLRRKPPVRWWWGLLGGVLYAALLLTHTRAAFAALAFGLVLLAIAQRRICRWRLRRAASS